MYGIGLSNMAIDNWRVMFIICGGLTVVSGILFITFLPRDPSKAWFLKEHERKVAVERLAQDRATRDRSEFNWAQAKEAITDPRTWLYCSMALFICIPTPIVKASMAASFPLTLTNIDSVLVQGRPWIRVLVPRDNARRPARRCSRIHSDLDRRSGANVLSQHSVPFWHTLGGDSHVRQLIAPVSPCRSTMGHCGWYMVRRVHGATCRTGHCFNGRKRQGQYQKVSGKRIVLCVLLRRLRRWPAAMARA